MKFEKTYLKQVFLQSWHFDYVLCLWQCLQYWERFINIGKYVGPRSNLGPLCRMSVPVCLWRAAALARCVCVCASRAALAFSLWWRSYTVSTISAQTAHARACPTGDYGELSSTCVAPSCANSVDVPNASQSSIELDLESLETRNSLLIK